MNQATREAIKNSIPREQRLYAVPRGEFGVGVLRGWWVFVLLRYDAYGFTSLNYRVPAHRMAGTRGYCRWVLTLEEGLQVMDEVRQSGGVHIL